MTPMRFQTNSPEYQSMIHALKARIIELSKQQGQERTKQNRQGDVARARSHTSASSSSTGLMPKNLLDQFESVKTILLGKYGTPVKEEPQGQTPPEGSRSRDKSIPKRAESEQPRATDSQQ